MIDFESKMTQEQREQIEYILKNYGFDPNLTVNEFMNFVSNHLDEISRQGVKQ